MACIFCKIARGEAHAWRVYEDDEILVILDIYPVEKGHLLVISKEHYESIHDAPPEIVAKVFLASAALSRIYRERLNAPGVNVIANSGRASGQEIFHFHVHVIPRWQKMGWRGLTSRHRLTEEEALSVLNMLGSHISLIKEYLSTLERH